MFRHLRRNSDGSVAAETAVFAPVFLVMMLGVADLGGGMFARMQVNAAAQAGAAYAVLIQPRRSARRLLQHASTASSRR